MESLGQGTIDMANLNKVLVTYPNFNSLTIYRTLMVPYIGYFMPVSMECKPFSMCGNVNWPGMEEATTSFTSIDIATSETLVIDNTSDKFMNDSLFIGMTTGFIVLVGYLLFTYKISKFSN